MEADGLLNLRTDAFKRIKAGHGVLHNHSNFPASEAAPFLAGLKVRNVLACLRNLTRFYKSVGVKKTDKALCENGFAGAGFTHDSKALALKNI